MSNNYVIVQECEVIATCASEKIAKEVCTIINSRYNDPNIEITFDKWYNAMQEVKFEPSDVYAKYPEYSISDWDIANNVYSMIDGCYYFEIPLIASEQDIINFLY